MPAQTGNQRRVLDAEQELVGEHAGMCPKRAAVEEPKPCPRAFSSESIGYFTFRIPYMTRIGATCTRTWLEVAAGVGGGSECSPNLCVDMYRILSFHAALLYTNLLKWLSLSTPSSRGP